MSWDYVCFWARNDVPAKALLAPPRGQNQEGVGRSLRPRCTLMLALRPLRSTTATRRAPGPDPAATARRLDDT